MKTAQLTLDRLKEMVSYDLSTGEFVWVARGRGIRTGRRAGSVERKHGYRMITVDGVEYYAQRLAWFWVNGAWPRLLRFQNGNHDDCRIDNLCEGFYLDTRHDRHTPAGKAAYAKEYRAQNPDRMKEISLQKKFGITLAEYVAMAVAQGGKCAICDHPETEMRGGKVKALAVDHDHETGQIRGLLCVACNTGLGKMKEDRSVLLSAIRYLDKHSGDERVASLTVVKEAQ